MPWLVLLGSSGAGKSHLVGKIMAWWEDAGKFYVHQRGAITSHRGQLVKWANLIKECRKKDSSRLDDLHNETLVAIDDIGAGADASKDEKGWMIDMLFHLLENRVSTEPGKPERATLITANLSLSVIESTYDARISSRLVRRGVDKVISVSLKDYKLRK